MMDTVTGTAVEYRNDCPVLIIDADGHRDASALAIWPEATLLPRIILVL